MKYLLCLLFSSCTYMNYGLTSIPDGCEINSYRQSDGTLKYYFTGSNCTETERTFRGRYDKND